MTARSAAKRLSPLLLLAGLAALFALPALGPGQGTQTASAQVSAVYWGQARTINGTYSTNYTAAGTVEQITNPNTTTLPDGLPGAVPLNYTDQATRTLRVEGTASTSCTGTLGTEAALASCTSIVENFRLYIYGFRAIDIARIEVSSLTVGRDGIDHSVGATVKVEGVCVRQTTSLTACLPQNPDGSYSFAREVAMTGTVTFPSAVDLYSLGGTGGRGQRVVGVHIRVNLEPHGSNPIDGEADFDLGIAESFIGYVTPPTPTPTLSPTPTRTPTPAPTPTPRPGVDTAVVVPMLSRD